MHLQKVASTKQNLFLPPAKFRTVQKWRCRKDDLFLSKLSSMLRGASLEDDTTLLYMHCTMCGRSRSVVEGCQVSLHPLAKNIPNGLLMRSGFHASGCCPAILVIAICASSFPSPTWVIAGTASTYSGIGDGGVGCEVWVGGGGLRVHGFTYRSGRSCHSCKEGKVKVKRLTCLFT